MTSSLNGREERSKEVRNSQELQVSSNTSRCRRIYNSDVEHWCSVDDLDRRIAVSCPSCGRPDSGVDLIRDRTV